MNELDKYDIDVSNFESDNTSHGVCVNMIRENSTILEFGCAKGYVGNYLKNNKSCELYAVEYFQEYAEVAKEYYNDIWVGDIENFNWVDKFANIEFDYILLMDVLEHLRNPEIVLEKIKQFMGKNTEIIISVPNIANNAVIMELMDNEFKYSENGILDRTHLKHFTYKSLCKTVKEIGFNIYNINATYSIPETSGFDRIYEGRHAELINKEYGDVYQFIIKIGTDFTRKTERNIESKNKTIYNAQIYYADSMMFDEENSIKQQIFTSNDAYTVKIDISKLNSDIKFLRFDPVDFSIFAKKITVYIQAFDGHVKTLDPCSTNALFVDSKGIFFDSIDPNLIYDVNDINLENYEFLYADVSYYAFGEFRKNMLDFAQKTYTSLNHLTSDIKEKETILSELEIIFSDQEKFNYENSTLIEKVNNVVDELNIVSNNEKNLNVKIGELSSELHNLYLHVEHLENKHSQEIESKNHAIYEILNSTSWKISKPIRIIKDLILFLLAFTKKAIKKTAKFVYRRLPLSFSTKIKLKKFILKVFKPFVKNTYMYNIYYGDVQEVDNTSQTQVSVVNNGSNVVVVSNQNNVNCYETKNFKSIDADSALFKLIAFYLPQFHPIPENDEWWGKGFTEWTNTSKAVPLFEGHYQPRLPGELGYYDLRLKESIVEQAKLLKEAGLYGLAIYHYWFNGHKLIETPSEIIYNNKDIDLNYCLCWANENWTRRWDGAEAEILMAQDYNESSYIEFAKDLEKFVKDERYIRIDDKPVVMVYNIKHIPDCKEFTDVFRKYMRENGVGEVYFLGVIGVDRDLNRPYTDFGLDAYMDFAPHNVINEDNFLNTPHIKKKDFNFYGNFEGIILDYEKMSKNTEMLSKSLADFNSVTLQWDNTARRGTKATVFENFSVDNYKRWMKNVFNETLKRDNNKENIVFINAWNEWAEGTYLEPDRKYGYTFLNATNEMLYNATHNKKIIYVSHDERPHGAQILSLNIMKTLKEVFKYEVMLILKENSKMSDSMYDDFKVYADVIVDLQGSTNYEEKLDKVVSDFGAKIAIANTAVSGDLSKYFKSRKIKNITLVHELPEIIKNYGIKNNLNTAVECSDKVIFPAEYVKVQDSIFFGESDNIMIRPQGLYSKNPYLAPEYSKEGLKKQYGLDNGRKIVLSVGLVDNRKGFDLFIDVAKKVAKESDEFTFVWVGTMLEESAEKIKKLTADMNENQIRFLPPTKEIGAYYVMSDLYVMTSREDPFPSVVMESMDASVPVIGFKEAGGFTEIVTEDRGILVDYLNTDQMANAVVELTRDTERYERLARNSKELIETKFNFVGYIYDLLELLGHKYEKVSVVVPNYNYENYLPERLDSILNQTYPISEIVFLDDKSSDNSLELAKKYQNKHPHLFKIYPNEVNAGNVSKQWKKGFELSSGDYVWICEADDVADSTFLERLVPKMVKNNSILGHTQSKVIDEKSKLVANDFLIHTDDIDRKLWRSDFDFNGVEFIKNYLVIKNTIANVSSVLIKKGDYSEIFDKCTDYKIGGDLYFYINLLKMGNISYIADSLNSYRIHKKSVTKSDNERHFNEIVSLQNYVIDEFEVKEDVVQQTLAYRERVKEVLKY